MLTNGEGFSFELCSSIRPSLKKLLEFYNIRVSDLIPSINNVCKLSRDMSSIAVVTVYNEPQKAKDLVATLIKA
jgi:hypothetical protein